MISRKKEINTLLEIIDNRDKYKENSENGLVILLNGEWGSGKTTFIQEIKDRVELSEKYKLLGVYNSFEYDFYSNAYIPLFATIVESISSIKEEAKNIIKITGKNIAKDSLNFVLNIGNEAIKDITNIDIKKGIENIKNISKNLNQDYDYLNDFEEFKKNKDKIKKELEKKCKKNPHIFIIDELDRCNPRFAIETLEIVKHFFDIENCIFIIAVDKGQLFEAAKTIFGQGMDADIYFSKFFDYQFNLDRIPFYNVVNQDKIAYFNEIVSESSVLFDTLNISLRDSKRIFSEFENKYISFCGEKENWDYLKSLCIIFLLCLKYTDLSFYNKILGGEYLNIRKKIESGDDPLYYKYYKVINMTIFDEPIYNNFLFNFSKYGKQRYLDTKYLNYTVVSYPERAEVEILKIMHSYIPQVKIDATYLENIKEIMR